MVNYDLMKEKRWREFIRAIRFNEVAQFSATPADVDCLRTTAGRINSEDGLDYVYAIEANSETGRCQVYTKPRL